MPSKDVTTTHIPKSLEKEIERIREVISDENGILLNKKEAFIFLKTKSELAKLSKTIVSKLVMDIKLGKIKWIKKDQSLHGYL